MLYFSLDLFISFCGCISMSITRVSWNLPAKGIFHTKILSSPPPPPPMLFQTCMHFFLLKRIFWGMLITKQILRNHMMRFQVFLSLWSVTSCLYLDKIPKVAKTKVSNPKRYSLWIFKACPCPPKMAHSNTPPHVYVTMWKYLQNAAQMFTQRKKMWFQ